MTEFEKFQLDVELEALKKDVGTDHPFARAIGCRIAEIKNLLSPKPVPQIEEQLNLELLVPMSFDELFWSCLMLDYFYPLVDARAQLAGANTIMKGYLEAIENNNSMVAESWLNLMKQEVADIENLLEAGIGEKV